MSVANECFIPFVCEYAWLFITITVLLIFFYWFVGLGNDMQAK